MRPTYIFRLDDICPEMDWAKFNRLKAIFNRYSVKPIIGVIPDNQDPTLKVNPSQKDFWPLIRRLHQSGWIIAQHGYEHRYVNNEAGLVGITHQSEFAGLTYDEQYQKIKSGQQILDQKLGFKPQWFMAPSHSFDQNTCKALKGLGFKYITDGIYLAPVNRYGLLWLPQQLWRPSRKWFGAWTICIHPNSTSEVFFNQLEKFLAVNHQHCQMPPLKPQPNLLNGLFRLYWHGGLKLYRLVKRK